MTVTIPTTDWQGRLGDDGQPDRAHAGLALKCPGCDTWCGFVARVIDRDGNMTPGFVCPATDCTFNEHVTLEGW